MSEARNLTQKENSDAPSGFHEPGAYQPNNRAIDAHLNEVLPAQDGDMIEIRQVFAMPDVPDEVWAAGRQHG